MMNKIPQTIIETQELLVKKEVKVIDLVEMYLNRIDRLNSDLNVFLTVSKDIAYEQAKKADKLLADFGKEAFVTHPLLGICVGYKDMFLTKGIRTTAASKLLESYIPTYSATAVERLQNAGAICIGKVNCDAWAHGSSGENSDYGPAKNPWNMDYTPGGSSSGSGAALAADMALVTTGTDTCGSIRLPANYCGVVGLKPTYGSVSRYGIVAMASSLDSIGHMGNCVDDVQKVYAITKGKDNHDSTVTEVDLPVKKDMKDIVIGVPKEFFQEGLDKVVHDQLLKAIEVYRSLGAKIVDISLPTTEYAIDVYYVIQPAEVSSNLGRYDGVRYGNGRDSFGSEAKRRILLGTFVLSSGYYDAYYSKAMKVRTKIINEITNAFSKVDAIIAPVAPTPPFKLGEKISDPLQMYLTDIYAATANLCGIPALAMPFGKTSNGLPLGYQLMGKRFSEEQLFWLGKEFEKYTKYEIIKPNI